MIESVGTSCNLISPSNPMEKVTFEQRLEEIGRISHVDIWGKSIPGKGNSKAGSCLVHLKNCRKPVWLEQWELEGGLWKMREGNKTPIVCRLVGHCRDSTTL